MIVLLPVKMILKHFLSILNEVLSVIFHLTLQIRLFMVDELIYLGFKVNN